MTGSVLVLNAGSSSLKYQVLDAGEQTVAGGTVERVDETGWDDAFDEVTSAMAEAGVDPGDLLAVGHRVVHGGDRYTEPTLVDDEVERGHRGARGVGAAAQPPALAGIRATRAAFPDLRQVAVFDTAFFAGLPGRGRDVRRGPGREPSGWASAGTARTASATQHVAGEAARFLGRPEDELALVVLHLGNGASAAAVRGGAPVDTSMGLTPLEGLVMGTRPGDVDAGVLLHLLRHGYDVDRLEDLLHHRSGLQGLAGRHDFRDLLSAVDAGDETARTAYEVYCHRLRKYVGALPRRARRRGRGGLHRRSRGERGPGACGRAARAVRARHRGGPGPQPGRHRRSPTDRHRRRVRSTCSWCRPTRSWRSPGRSAPCWGDRQSWSAGLAGSAVVEGEEPRPG